MGIVGKILSEENKQIALKNNLALQTVYERIKRGWEVERAITEPPKRRLAHVLKANREKGYIQSNDENRKGKPRNISLYAKDDQRFEEALFDSGKGASMFIADAMHEYLDYLESGLWLKK